MSMDTLISAAFDTFEAGRGQSVGLNCTRVFDELDNSNGDSARKDRETACMALASRDLPVVVIEGLDAPQFSGGKRRADVDEKEPLTLDDGSVITFAKNGKVSGFSPRGKQENRIEIDSTEGTMTVYRDGVKGETVKSGAIHVQLSERASVTIGSDGSLTEVKPGWFERNWDAIGGSGAWRSPRPVISKIKFLKPANDGKAVEEIELK